MQKARLLSVMFKRARPLICLQATLMGSVKARNKSYTLLDPCESGFQCLQTNAPTPCCELCKLMTDRKLTNKTLLLVCEMWGEKF